MSFIHCSFLFPQGGGVGGEMAGVLLPPNEHFVYTRVGLRPAVLSFYEFSLFVLKSQRG